MKYWSFVSLFIFTCSAKAQTLVPNYFLEFTPILGLDLPYQVNGTSGILSVIGLKTSYSLPTGSVELGTFIHHSDPDRIFSTALGYRYEIPINPIVGFASVGYHASLYQLVVEDRDVPQNGLADTGWYFGPYLGGGMLLPTNANTSVRLGMYYYYKPSLWLFLEAGLGYRF